MNVEESYRRLEILLLLEEDMDYKKPLRLIQRILELRGLSVSYDRLQLDLRWLEEMGLVEVEELPGGAVCARLTHRGEDVALGRTQVPGVARPGPDRR